MGPSHFLDFPLQHEEFTFLALNLGLQLSDLAVGLLAEGLELRFLLQLLLVKIAAVRLRKLPLDVFDLGTHLSILIVDVSQRVHALRASVRFRILGEVFDRF